METQRAQVKTDLFRNKNKETHTFVDANVDRVIVVVKEDSILVLVVVAVGIVDGAVVATRVGPTMISGSVT